jgi:cyclophilin family peptidyl-prolyl cis-trans isomerase
MKVKRGGRERMRTGIDRTAGFLVLTWILASGGIGVVSAEEASSAKTDLRATLERLGNFFYEGDPVQVRISVFNTGTQPYDNSGGLDLLGGIIVGTQTGSGEFKRKPSSVSASRFQPAVIPPGGFFGFITDLREVIGGIEKPGRFVARLSLEDLKTDPIKLIVIPRYDPEERFRATIETAYGELSFDLLGKEAPKHVRNFYALAHQGFYEGALFHAVVKGVHILGGDTVGDGSGFPGYGIPREIDPNKVHARGTLSMLPWRDMDHGGQFLISLAGNTNLDGRFSIFGILAGGEEALTALENLPTTGQREQPFYRPLKETKILSVRIAAAPEGSKATAEGAETSVGEATEPEARQ